MSMGSEVALAAVARLLLVAGQHVAKASTEDLLHAAAPLAWHEV